MDDSHDKRGEVNRSTVIRPRAPRMPVRRAFPSSSSGTHSADFGVDGGLAASNTCGPRVVFGSGSRHPAGPAQRHLHTPAFGNHGASTYGGGCRTWPGRASGRARRYVRGGGGATHSPHLGRQALAKLTPRHLQAWLRLRAAGVSANRQRYARVVLRTALNTAVKWALIVRNPATLVDAPRVTSRQIRPLTPDQARQFIKSAWVIVWRRCSLSRSRAG